MQIKTAGDLRGFLADVMIGIRTGTVEPTQAHAISKIAAQINQSLAVEVNTALQLERMGKDHPVAGSMLIGSPHGSASAILEPTPLEVSAIEAHHADDNPDPWRAPDADKIWCDQCEDMVPLSERTSCKSKFCKAKPA